MKTFNITAQVYETRDNSKQSILFNKEVPGYTKEHAIEKFKNYYLALHYKLLKIYSVEEISKDAS